MVVLKGYILVEEKMMFLLHCYIQFIKEGVIVLIGDETGKC